MKPKVLVIRTAGTNCDKESAYAFELAGGQTELKHLNYLKIHKNISQYQIICFPGGFSYGDDLGAGKIFSLELNLWLKNELKKFADKGGLMIGICNGFQIMVKTGILPDAKFKQTVTLANNDSGRFEDRWTYLKVESKKLKVKSPENIWTKNLPEVIMLPVAHGEGKFTADSKALRQIEANGQTALRYCDCGGESAGYPYNPNAAMNDIAGITDITGRILGLMPHPERFIFTHQNSLRTDKFIEPFGLSIFKNAVEYFK